MVFSLLGKVDTDYGSGFPRGESSDFVLGIYIFQVYLPAVAGKSGHCRLMATGVWWPEWSGA